MKISGQKLLKPSNIFLMNESKYLGKVTAYPKKYAPEVLVPVPRQINRSIYGLAEKNLPFTGVDTWHAYELSFLTKRGMPVTGVLKLIYSASSQFLIESKSLKLYLNSFNMERFGKTPDEGIKDVLNIIKRDIEAVLHTPVEANIFRSRNEKKIDFVGYEILEDLPGMQDTEFNEYSENPNLLKPEISEAKELKAATHLLRSNCKVTFQPDWGSAFIYLKGDTVPDKKELLKYLVSIRNENHFHEEICEMIYKRLWDIFSPEKLMVACIYTRRGGIDICPARASHERLLPKNLISPNKLTDKLLRQ